MTDASDPSYPTPFFPYENIGEPFLQMTNSQTETESYYPVSSPQVANPVFPGKETPAAFSVKPVTQQSLRLPRSSLRDFKDRRDFYDTLTPSIHVNSKR